MKRFREWLCGIVYRLGNWIDPWEPNQTETDNENPPRMMEPWHVNWSSPQRGRFKDSEAQP